MFFKSEQTISLENSYKNEIEYINELALKNKSEDILF